MLYETTSGPASPIQVGGKTDSSMMMLAVMVILVIFVFIIFAIFAFRNERKDGYGGGMEALAPILATTVAANASRNNEYGYARDNYAFDLHAQGEARSEHLMQIRDTLIQSGETKERILESQYQLDQNIQRNHYDTLSVVKEDGEKTRALIVQQEREKLLAEVAYLRSRDLHHGFNKGNQATVNVQDIGVNGGYGYAW